MIQSKAIWARSNALYHGEPFLLHFIAVSPTLHVSSKKKSTRSPCFWLLLGRGSLLGSGGLFWRWRLFLQLGRHQNGLNTRLVCVCEFNFVKSVTKIYKILENSQECTNIIQYSRCAMHGLLQPGLCSGDLMSPCPPFPEAAHMHWINFMRRSAHKSDQAKRRICFPINVVPRWPLARTECAARDLATSPTLNLWGAK